MSLKYIHRYDQENVVQSLGEMSLLSDGEFFGLGTSMLVLLTVGCAFQAFTLLVLMQPAFKQFDLSPYFLNIMLANSVVVLVDFPPTIASAWAQENMLGEIYCQIVGFLSCVGCISTVVTLALCILKIHRKLSDDDMEIEMAFAERDSWERHKIIKTLTGTWLYGIAIMFPPLVGWGSFNFESGDTVCAPNWRENNPAGRIYSVLLVIFAFVIPLGVSMAYFVKMYKRSSYEPDINATASGDRKRAKKAVIMILIGVIIFVVGWTPYYACAMMSVFGGPEMFDPATSFIPGILAKASAVFNPLICLLVSKRFRTVAVKVICVCRKIETDEQDDLSHSRQLPPSMLMRRNLHEELRRMRRMRRYQQTRAEARLMRIYGMDRPENRETSV